MSGKIFEYKNTYTQNLQRNITKLYLNSKTADVNFVFDANTHQSEKVPAHKTILSLDNPKFEAMFYGPNKERSDIQIKEISAAAFKEFLQFFYLDQVTLTAVNFVQVINLCKTYGMNEYMKACETTLRKSLTINDMCFGYGIALVLEQTNLIEFCERKIKNKANAREIMKSDSFLESDRISLERILKLVLSNWSALETIHACMEWAKADCDRNKLESNSKNLRNQLGELFNLLPFDKLTLKEFTQLNSVAYFDFFDTQETKEINQKILLQTKRQRINSKPDRDLVRKRRRIDVNKRHPGKTK